MAAGDLDLLALDVATLFVLSESKRIERVNSPDGEAGPRVFLAGCRGGNLVRLRQDVGDTVARDIAAVVKNEPPWFDAASPPPCLSDLASLLSREAPVTAINRGIVYVLPNGLRREVSAPLVSAEDAEGQALLQGLASEGMPRAFREAGFLAVADFWPPWCAALEGAEIAAIAFAARLGDRGAEVGVFTFPGHRGRGLAAAVTARWSSLAALAGRRLFYSTLTTNRSSQRVAQRLGLTTLGATLALA